MLDQRGQLLRAALGFAGLPRPSYDRSLWTLRTWLDSWAGIGRIAVGMARHLLYDRDGALDHERYDLGVGAHAVACDAAGGVGGSGAAVMIQSLLSRMGNQVTK